MASLSYIVYVLVSLLNPISYLLYGHDQFNYKPAHDNEVQKKALFVFGDSLFDPGNDQYLPNVTVEDYPATTWPYGETFFHHPNGRLSDGRIVPDFIANFANLRMLPPYLQPDPKDFTDGASFASAGAGVLVETDPGTINLPLQLSYFKNVTELLQEQLGDEEAKKLLGSAVYLISMGGNDYFTFYAKYQENATESVQQEYIEIVIGNLTTALQGIYDLGGRKIAFQNAGPLGCLPHAKQSYDSHLVRGCVEGLQSLARQHNKALASVLKELESQLPGFKYSIFEYYDALGDRVLNPAKYGRFAKHYVK
ncbi:GDSL lipase [Rosa chinensis]|uniref:GDSL lipase n=1 Tax=Rosa chinensis TaxID=74649 RepID=UPI001AD8EB7A|nr:GDSL lipase [Rosa chinensis]